MTTRRRLANGFRGFTGTTSPRILFAHLIQSSGRWVTQDGISESKALAVLSSLQNRSLGGMTITYTLSRDLKDSGWMTTWESFLLLNDSDVVALNATIANLVLRTMLPSISRRGKSSGKSMDN